MNTSDKGEWTAIDICPVCKKERGIVFDKKLRNRFKNQYVVTSFYLCDDCIKRLTELDRIILYEATGIDPKKGPQITSRYMEVNAEPFRHNITEEQLNFLNKNRISFCDEMFFEKLLTVRSEHATED